MRNYVTKSNQGGLPDSLTATKLGAGETNSVLNELENSVTYSGQTLAPSDGTGEVATQLAQSLFLHGVKSSGFQDSGSANTYEVTPISGSGGVRIPASYANMDGATIWFIPANASNAGSTLNIGQTAGTLLGAKALLNNDGSAITTELTTDQPFEVRYDSSADGGSGGWLLQPWSTSVDAQTFEVFHAQHQETSGTAGGTCTLGSYETRTVNTVLKNEITGASLSTNQITLPAGDYRIFAQLTGVATERYKGRLYNVTDAAEEVGGSSEFSTAGGGTTVHSYVSGDFTIASSKVFEIQSQVSRTQASTGYGLASSFGTEVYVDVIIWKIT